MTIAQELALWADKLRELAVLGLHYADNIYERDRWAQAQNMALEMLARATGEPLEQLEPLRLTIFQHATPFVVGDAAIIDDTGRMLLIQRADNGLWAMPGGAFEVGETPAEGAVREALEETGIACTPVALVGVFDSRYCGTVSTHQLYQFTFLCRPTADEPQAAPTHQHEVRQIGWFGEDELPAAIDLGHVTRIPVAFQVWRGERPAFFDQATTAYR